MKLLHNKITEVAILLPIITFFAIAGYVLFDTYKDYTHAKEAQIHTEYVALLQETLTVFDNEKSAVGIYLGSNGRSDFNLLEAQWKQSDKSVQALQEFVQQHPRFLKETEAVFKALEFQKENRSNISVLNTSFEALYFQKEDPAVLIETILQTATQKSDTVLKTATTFSSLESTVLSERAITSYFISRGKPIAEAELELWDPLIDLDTQPDYHQLRQNALLGRLDTLFQTPAYKRLLQQITHERINIITGSANGSFATDLTAWYDLLSTKASMMHQASELLFEHIQKGIDQEIAHDRQTMSIAAVILLITFLLALVVHNIFTRMAQEAEELEAVLKTIDQNDSQEVEPYIKEMLAKQNKREIYQFLAHTIRESKESKRLADEANATKSKFLANMSHEIRTPLNGIVGFTGLLKTTELDTEQQEFIDIIEKSSENLLAVINDILDLSKIENNKIEIEAIAFDPIEEFESGIESYGAKAAEKNIDLGLYIDPELPHNLLGDPTRIKQVIVNLISNAVKFTPENGSIDVIIEKVPSPEQETRIKFSVKDSGIGITPQQKVKIFEAFSQADASTNRKFGGTGLGLTISKTLVELMGGRLDLTSEENEGTTFFFSLLLETIDTVEEKEYYDVLNVGHLLPEAAQKSAADSYAQTYIKAINKNNYLYTDIEQLLELQQDQQPDLLFVNYAHITKDTLQTLTGLKSKIVVMTTVREKNELDNAGSGLYKVIYAPINYTKIKKTIAALSLEETKAQKAEAPTRFNNLHALVAEDNVINQKLIKRSLENIGIDVTLAENGEVAYRQYQDKNSKFDVVFMDIQMPVMDGIEATQAILGYEKEHGLEHTPIIALTANALKGDKEYFLSQGLDQYVSKPMKLDVIVNMLLFYFEAHLLSEETAEEETPLQEPEVETVKEVEPVPEAPVIKQSVDILLFKNTFSETKIFSAILRKIGYSVDVANSLKEFEEMLDEKIYHYALYDKSAHHEENLSVIQKLKEVSIASLLFVPDMQTVGPEDRDNHTYVARNVADLQLLRFLMAKLTSLDNDKYKRDIL